MLSDASTAAIATKIAFILIFNVYVLLLTERLLLKPKSVIRT